MSRVFLAICLISCLFCNFSWANNDDFYTIDDIMVHGHGDSPSQAKNNAFDQSRKIGLELLFTKLKLDPELINEFSPEDLEETIKSEQIKSEVIAGNNYSANFKITYDKDYIAYILKNKDLESLDIEENYLVLAITKVDDDKILLWEKSNLWQREVIRAIDANLNRNNKNKLIIPDADIETISLLSNKAVMQHDFNKFQPLLAKYNAHGVYLIFFSNDAISNKIIADTYLIKQKQNKHIKLTFINTNSVADSKLKAKVAKKVVNYLVSLQGKKLRKAINDLIELEIHVSSYRRYLKIKNKIRNSGLISKLIVKSISKDRAVILVKYPNKNSNIINAFANIGIDLEQVGPTNYRID